MTFCLDKNNPEIKKWFKAVGQAETYKQFLIHNYNLPTYNSFIKKNALGGISKVERNALLNSYLNLDNYSIEQVDKILNLLPETEAAFWQNSFYFADSTNKLQVNEEAFHAIFQTLTSPEERKALFSIAEKLLENKLKKANQSKSEFIAEFKKTHSKLSDSKLIEYILEEELAKEWVNWITYDNDMIRDSKYRTIWNKQDSTFVDKIIETIKEFFNKLRDLVSGYNKQKDFLEHFFSKIKSGENRVDNVVYEFGHTLPSQSTITIYPDEKGREPYIFNVLDQQNHYNRILSVALQLKELNLVDDNGFLLEESELIDTAIKEYSNNVLSTYPLRSAEHDLYLTLPPIESRLNPGVFRNTPVYNAFHKDILKKYEDIQVAKEDLDADYIEKEEDEKGSASVVSNQSDAANQIDREKSLPKRIRILIGSTEVKDTNDQPIEITRKRLNDDGKLEDFTFTVIPRRMVDPARVYAALARATTNTIGEFDRLKKLIIFSEDVEFNGDTCAFLDNFLEKVFETQEGKPITSYNKRFLKDAIIRNNWDKYQIKDHQLFKLVLKNFDLWTRRNLSVKVTDKGSSTVYDPNTTNVRARQLDQWSVNWESKNAFQLSKDYAQAGAKSDDKIFSYSENSEEENEKLREAGIKTFRDLNSEKATETIEQSLINSENALKSMFNFYGIKTSKNFLKFIVADRYVKEGIPLPTGSFKDVYTTLFFSESEFDLKLPELKAAFLQIRKVGLEAATPYEESDDNTDISSHAKIIAYGNSFFDESVLASTFLNPDKKTIYAHQLQTYMLKFGNNTLKSLEKYKNHVISLYKENAYNQYAYKNNFLHDFYFKDLRSNKERSNLESFTFTGAALHKEDRSGNMAEELKTAVNDINPKDFVAQQMNVLLHKAKEIVGIERDDSGQVIQDKIILAPYYLGHNETSNTHSFFTGKWMKGVRDEKNIWQLLVNPDGSVGEGAINLAIESLTQQQNRIVAFKKELEDTIISKVPITDAETTVLKLTEKTWRENGFTGSGLVHGFYTGSVPLKKENDSWIIDYEKFDKKTVRGLTISGNLNGYIADKEIIYKEIFGTKSDSYISTLRESVKQGLQKTISYSLEQFDNTTADNTFKGGVIHPNSARKANVLGLKQGQSQINQSLFILNSMFNREAYQRILHGDQALTNKDELLDVIKRNKGEEAQVISAHTELVDTFNKVGKFTEMKGVQMIEGDDTNVPEEELELSGVSGNIINSNDGATLRSAEHALHYLHGIAKLNRDLVLALDKLISGRDFSTAETKALLKSGEFLTVEKTRQYSSMTDMKTAETLLYKNLTAQKVKVDKKSDFYTSIKNYVEVELTRGGESYRSLYKEGATHELTVEYNNIKYKSFDEAIDANDYDVFEWIPISPKLDEKRKLMEGWRYNSETNTWNYSSNNKIGFISPISVHKRLKQDVWDGDIKSFQDYNIHTYSTLDYGRQVENAPHNSILDPTQQLEILTSNLPDSVKIINGDGSEKTYSKDEITSKFFKHLADRTKLGGAEVVSLLMNKDKVNYDEFYTVIRESLAETGGDVQMVEMFTVDQNGKPKYNGNLPLNKSKLEQHLFSILSKDVLSHRVPGDALAMISPKEMSFLKVLVKQTINGREIFTWQTVQRSSPEFVENFKDAIRLPNNLTYNGYELINGGDPKLNTLNESLKAIWREDKPVYFYDSLRHLKPRFVKNEKGETLVENYYSEAVIPLRNIAHINSFNENRFVQGVRIPSQDKATSANIEIVDWMDAVLGNTLAIAKEIQELSGSDFDIDKLYVQFYEGYVKNKIFTRYENTFEDYLEYSFSSSKTLKKLLKTTEANNEELQDINKKFNSLKYNKKLLRKKKDEISAKNSELTNLKNIYFKLKKEYESEDSYEIDGFEAYKELSKKFNTKSSIPEEERTEKDQQDLDILEAAIDVQEELMRLYISKESLGSIPYQHREAIDTFIKSASSSVKQNKNLSKEYAESYSKILEEEKELSAKKLKIIDEIKIEILKKASLPYNVDTFEKVYGNTGYKAIINNELLDLKKSLLTANISAYSTPTSVSTLKNYFSGEPNSDYLGISTPEFEKLVAKEPVMPLHSPAFDIYYRERTLAGKMGISATVNTNLIWLQLSRAGVGINPKYFVNLTVGDKTITYDKFELFTKQVKDEVSRPVSEHNSEIITAGTDEAKEGVLAKYNLIGDLLPLFTVGQSLGMHPQVLIMLVNHPTLQTLAKRSIKNPLKLSGTKSLLELVEKEIKSNGLTEELGFDNVLNLSIDLEEIRTLKKENALKTLVAAYKILKVYEANQDLSKIIKLKRGFESTYENYLETHKAIKRLGLQSPVLQLNNNDAYPDITDIHDVYYDKNGNPGLDLNAPGFELTKVYLERTLPIINKVVENVLMEGSNNYREIFNYVHASIKTADYLKPELTQAINRALLGSLASNNPILKEKLSVELLMGKDSVATNFMNFLRTNEELKKQPLFKKLIPKLGYQLNLKKLKKMSKNKGKSDDELMGEALDIAKVDTITLNLFGKLDPTVQVSIIDNFVQLQNVEGKENIELKQWLSNLLPYYMMKDAMGYNPISLSKILPVREFATISEEYDYFMEDKMDKDSLDFIKKDVLTRIFRDTRNKLLIEDFELLKEGEDPYLFYTKLRGQTGKKLKNKSIGKSIAGKQASVITISTMNHEPNRYSRFLKIKDDVYRRVGAVYLETKKDFVDPNNEETYKYTTTMYVKTLEVGNKDYHASIANKNIVPDKEVYYDYMISLNSAIDELTQRNEGFSDAVIQNIKDTYNSSLDVFVYHNERLLSGQQYINIRQDEAMYEAMSSMEKEDLYDNDYITEKLETDADNLRFFQTGESNSTEIITVSEDYGVVKVDTNPSLEKTKEFVEIIKPQIQAQLYKENKGKFANEMFHYGLMWARNNPLAKPVEIDKFEGKSNTYNYHALDQNGNPLPSVDVLAPIIKEIENSLKLDMSDYDSVIGNIYLDDQYIYPHKDTTESKSARNYPVIVYTLGNDAGLGIVDNNNGKMTFANQYDTKWLSDNDKLKGYTNELLTKNGSIYTFGLDGKGRFELTHSTPINNKKLKDFPPITLPNGKIVTKYTITLTFRRAKDLSADVPVSPVKLENTVQPVVETSTEPINIFYSSGENKELSNFAYRPFVDEWEFPGQKFNTVEAAYHAAKLNYSKLVDEDFNLSPEGERIFNRLAESVSGGEAWSARPDSSYINPEWNSVSLDIMKNLLKASFKANPDSLQALLNTGNRQLTHNQAKGIWKEEFPRLLMEVREEFKKDLEPEEGLTEENKALLKESGLKVGEYVIQNFKGKQMIVDVRTYPLSIPSKSKTYYRLRNKILVKAIGERVILPDHPNLFIVVDNKTGYLTDLVSSVTVQLNSGITKTKKDKNVSELNEKLNDPTVLEKFNMLPLQPYNNIDEFLGNSNNVEDNSNNCKI